jgi:hypothetical protein
LHRRSDLVSRVGAAWPEALRLDTDRCGSHGCCGVLNSLAERSHGFGFVNK